MTATATKPAAPTAPETAATPATRQAVINFATDKLGTRRMVVNALLPEQLAVYQRTAARFDREVSDDMNADDARKAFDRSIRIVVSPLADPADVEWVEDQFIDGKLTLIEAAKILTLTLEAFADKAPTTGPAPKTTRARRAR